MANVLLRCRRSVRGRFQVKTLETVLRTITDSSKNYSSYDYSKCPSRDDSRNTEEECKKFKRNMEEEPLESTCNRNDSKTCDSGGCEKQAVPEDVFNQENCKENPLYRSACEIAQWKKCLAEHPHPNRCRMEKPVCHSREKVYPMREAGLKPEIDGRPITGDTWKKKSWGIKKC